MDGILETGGGGGRVWGTGGLPIEGGRTTVPGGFGGTGGLGSGGGSVLQGGSGGNWNDGSASDSGGQSLVDGSCGDRMNLLLDTIWNTPTGRGVGCELTTKDGGGYSGQVVLDQEGRVIDNTGIDDAASRQAWLDSIADQRWPCLAGQVLQYLCRPL